jgi:hypothetical protein
MSSKFSTETEMFDVGESMFACSLIVCVVLLCEADIQDDKSSSIKIIIC